jgi:hypothetical protein
MMTTTTTKTVGKWQSIAFLGKKADIQPYLFGLQVAAEAEGLENAFVGPSSSPVGEEEKDFKGVNALFGEADEKHGGAEPWPASSSGPAIWRGHGCFSRQDRSKVERLETESTCIHLDLLHSGTEF